MPIKVFPYRAGSRSARALADALEGRVLRREGSKYNRRDGDLIINWGASDCPYNGRGVANQPGAIDPASNKLKCFEAMKAAGVSIPRFWTNMKDIPADAYPVMCRTKLQAHSGEGIVIADRPDQLVKAPLYTQYIKATNEYRVHAIRSPGKGTSIICVQRKAKRADAVDPDFRVRNLANGFVYVMEDNPPEDVVKQAKAALEASDLAFGAIDIKGAKKAHVLEINTAPGLEDRTAQAYAAKFREIYRDM